MAEVAQIFWRLFSTVLNLTKKWGGPQVLSQTHLATLLGNKRKFLTIFRVYVFEFGYVGII
jgi:hypothetical protein